MNHFEKLEAFLDVVEEKQQHLQMEGLTKLIRIARNTGQLMKAMDDDLHDKGDVVCIALDNLERTMEGL